MSLREMPRNLRSGAAALVLSLLVILIGADSTRAALLISNSGTGGIVFGANVNDANTLGWKFDVGTSPLSVTSLGFFDKDSDGLPSAVMVGLWKTSTASQLAAVTVPAGTGPTLINDYRFVSLGSPVFLGANTSYTIGYRSANGGLLQDGRDHANQGISSAVTIPSGGFGLRHSFDSEPLGTDFATQMPANNLGDSVPLTGPNMVFTAVPEPAGLALAMSVAIGVLRPRRKTPHLVVN